jgi:uncharacterized protein YdaU (DUF1376 family)
MPLYIADYLAKTAHLRALESGAYLHLIMHYWQHGKLPTEDRKLSAIARMTDLEWRRSRSTLAEFFTADWKHSRIEEELAHVAEVSSKRSASAVQRHSKRHANADANADANACANACAKNMQMDTHFTLHTHKEEVGGGGSARKRTNGLISDEAVKIADEVMAIAGLDHNDRLATPPGWCGAAARVETWLTHWSRETILAGAQAAMLRKRDGPPETPRFFEKPIARVHLRLSAPIPKNVDVERVYDAASRTPRRRTMLDALDDLRTELAEKCESAGGG